MNFLKFYSENTRLETRIFISLFSRPRRDRDFYKMNFRDRDETETRNLDREIREIETEARFSSNPGKQAIPGFILCHSSRHSLNHSCRILRGRFSFIFRSVFPSAAPIHDERQPVYSSRKMPYYQLPEDKTADISPYRFISRPLMPDCRPPFSLFYHFKKKFLYLGKVSFGLLFQIERQQVLQLSQALFLNAN